MKLEARFGRTDAGKPSIATTACSAIVQDLDVNFGGGLIGWVIDKFSKKIESRVRQAVADNFCFEAKKLIDMFANHELSTLPDLIPLSPMFTLDYKLIQAPRVTDDFVETDLKGEISWKGEGNTPFSAPPIPTNVTNDRMMYVWLSDFVINSFLFAAYNNQAMRFLVNKTTVPDVAPFLQTSCQKVCIGAIFHKIEKLYPNQSVSMYVEAAERPNCTIQPWKANTNATVLTKIFIENETESIPLMTLMMTFDGDVSFRVEEHTIVGNMTVEKLKLKILESQIGIISQFELDLMVMMTEPFLSKLANQKLQQGLPIPVFEGVDFVKPKISLLDRAVLIETDIKYKNYR